MKQRLFLTFFAIVSGIAISAISHAGAAQIPFFPGEKLTFKVKWAFISAAEVVLEILPMENIKGVKSYHFLMTAKTFAYIDPFYMVRDRIDAYADAEMGHSILYKIKKEGNSKKDITVQFDWEKGEVQYSDLEEKREPVAIPSGSFDPLSIFYVFRLFNLKEGREIEASVTDGKKWVLGKARVLKKEKIEVASGFYDTYLVQPELEQIGGVFEKSRDAKFQIWVTADERHIPVKIKSKVAVGHFVAELVSFEKGVTVNKN